MIVEDTIASQIEAMIKSAPNEQEKEVAIKYFSKGLANIIATAIKSGQVIVNPGQTTMSGVLPGVTTGTGTGFIQ